MFFVYYMFCRFCYKDMLLVMRNMVEEFDRFVGSFKCIVCFKLKELKLIE